MNVSPGFIKARKTPWLAWLPELGWTFANLQPNRRLTRSMARVSAMSTNSQPP